MRAVYLSTIAAVLVGCGGVDDQDASHPVADLVLTNGNVITVDENIPNAEAIAELSPHGYVTVNSMTAVGLQSADWDSVVFSLGEGAEYRCYLRVDDSVASGIAVVSMACEAAPRVLPAHGLTRLSKAEQPLPKPPQIIASDRGHRL